MEIGDCMVGKSSERDTGEECRKGDGKGKSGEWREEGILRRSGKRGLVGKSSERDAGEE